MVDLKPFFADINDYVILRLPDEYLEGGDIDILCRDREKVKNHILKVYGGFQTKVSTPNGHLHIDLCEADRLVFRFDLVDRLSYRKFSVDPHFSDVVLDSRRQVSRDGVSFYVPSLENELAIRLFEHFEYPEKVKHTKYINKHYWKCLEVEGVIEKYTNMDVEWPPKNFYKISRTCQVRCLDLMYEKFFGRCTDGCFVEVGAYDGEYVSNTSGLADVGWKGYYIEPVPEPCELCRTRHAKNKNITVSQIAIGNESKTVEMYVAGPLSTMNTNMTKVFQFRALKKQNALPIEVRQIPLEDYLAKHKIEPGFELLVVDVDGYEWEVFRNFDIEKWRPQMVIIELVAENNEYAFLHKDCRSLRRYFKEHNYRVVYKDLTNTVFILNSAPVERLDYFIIWGNGLRYTEEILNIIRGHKDLEILYIKKKPIDNIGKFVQDIYSCDAVPLQHLTDKTRYLLDTEPNIVFVLVKNNNAQEKYFGRGAFKHIQCSLIKDVKEEMRNRFNPKGTEHHVVHASDYASQVKHVLKVLDLPPIEYFVRQPNPDLDVPYHVQPFGNYVIKNVGIDQLHAVVSGKGTVPLKDTPHYKYVMGNKRPYLEYYEKHFGELITDDHSPDVFNTMIVNFEYDCAKKRGRHKSFIIARTFLSDKNKYQLVDGVHRAAILKYKGVKILPVVLCLAKSVVCLIYSKDRTMQLQAAIESLLLHCREHIEIAVLYKATSPLHQKQYDHLQKKYKNIEFQKEYDFKIQTRAIVSQFQYVMFLVDDNIFVKDFNLSDVVDSLNKNEDAIGFSLRLGRNINYCYPKRAEQKIPEFEKQDNILKFDWTKAEYDFGYPLEISSSVYKTNDLILLLRERDYANPNMLEGMLASSARGFGKEQNKLLCYEQSVAFSSPVNRVQDVTANHVRVDNKQSAENLAKLYDEGRRIDVESCSGFVPNSCQQEIELEHYAAD